ncbi:proline-rich receptor-like protein kinase PERK1 [Acrasis kona]|uniref:Proline-rich receptor-like protein kinase PERK1 n=1 Tax=Acrasis kona TaxID=1008807 RepID=A0AAW2ZMX3_9EUKA
MSRLLLCICVLMAVHSCLSETFEYSLYGNSTVSGSIMVPAHTNVEWSVSSPYLISKFNASLSNNSAELWDMGRLNFGYKIYATLTNRTIYYTFTTENYTDYKSINVTINQSKQFVQEFNTDELFSCNSGVYVVTVPPGDNVSYYARRRIDIETEVYYGKGDAYDSNRLRERTFTDSIYFEDTDRLGGHYYIAIKDYYSWALKLSTRVPMLEESYDYIVLKNNTRYNFQVNTFARRQLSISLDEYYRTDNYVLEIEGKTYPWKNVAFKTDVKDPLSALIPFSLTADKIYTCTITSIRERMYLSKVNLVHKEIVLKEIPFSLSDPFVIDANKDLDVGTLHYFVVPVNTTVFVVHRGIRTINNTDNFRIMFYNNNGGDLLYQSTSLSGSFAVSSSNGTIYIKIVSDLDQQDNKISISFVDGPTTTLPPLTTPLPTTPAPDTTTPAPTYPSTPSPTVPRPADSPDIGVIKNLLIALLSVSSAILFVLVLFIVMWLVSKHRQRTRRHYEERVKYIIQEDKAVNNAEYERIP